MKRVGDEEKLKEMHANLRKEVQADAELIKKSRKRIEKKQQQIKKLEQELEGNCPGLRIIECEGLAFLVAAHYDNIKEYVRTLCHESRFVLKHGGMVVVLKPNTERPDSGNLQKWVENECKFLEDTYDTCEYEQAYEVV